ncbi:hypothetical protein KEC55_30580 [Burkholderia cepacia]|uniref:hypothetical protein n=1 Tax=Burkholderia cepacia TaxID=292 RepID=UPI00249DE27B|nr:hypothetical protein [Burkholderia cepacia]WGY71341.1 hypothetical protein KEC55_30580 [Burkholderia cepacia]
MLAVLAVLAVVRRSIRLSASVALRIANANSVTTLGQRAAPKLLTLPQVEFNDFEAVLKRSFKQMHENAGALVKAHMESHGGSDSEWWIGDGQRFVKNDNCPFCGQSTKGLDIIRPDPCADWGFALNWAAGASPVAHHLRCARGGGAVSSYK